MKEAAEILEGYSANALKQIAQARVQDPKLPKPQLVRALAKVLWDPKEIEIFLSSMTPAQRTALQRAKQYGGQHLRPDLLQAQLEADGIPGAKPVINSLLRQGLLVYQNKASTLWDLWPAESHDYYYRYQPPLLRLPDPVAERIEVPEDLGKLPITPWTEPVERVVESPFATLQRDLYQFVQYLRENRVKLLKSGLLSKRDFGRINKLLTEPDDLEEVSTFDQTFRLQFLYLLLEQSQIIEAREDTLRLTAKAELFFRRSDVEQARTLLEAWRHFAEWNEFYFIPWILPDHYDVGGSDIPTHDRLPQARQDLLDLLHRERPHGQWFALPGLIASMQAYKLGFLIPNREVARTYFGFGDRAKADEPLYAGFRPRDSKNWKERYSKKEHWALVEGGFIAMLLQFPLRWLGIVRLGVKEDSITAFQVTEFGAAVLGWTDASAWAPAAPARALVVQPNFEMVAMLEGAGFSLLAELDRFAERVKLDKAALYRLTRESVCRGLQSGLTLDEILETLRARSGMPVPQNVEFTLREWEELFNRIHVRKRAIVVEAETEAELDKRLEELQLTGARRIAPTAALIDAAAARKLVAWGRGPHRRVLIHDYVQTTADTFRLADAREIEIRPGLGSPLLEHRLARIAVPMKNGRFLLDPERVRTAVAALGLDALVRFLEEGTGKSLSADTRLTLEGWGGKLPTVGLGKLTALAVPRAEVMDLLLGVPELARHARRLAPSVALIPDKDLPELRKALTARGVRLTDELDLDAALARKDEPDEVSLLFVKPKRRREIVEEAIALGRRLFVGYQNWNATRMVIHEIDPIKVLDTGGAGTLVAYSHKERYQAQFSIQQIQGIRMLDKPIDDKSQK